MLGEFDIDIENFSIGLLSAFGRLKRSMASAKFIAKHANTPNINHLIILISHDDLRRDIV